MTNKRIRFLLKTAVLFMVFFPSPAVLAADFMMVPPKALAWKTFLGVDAHFLWFQPDQYLKQLTMLKALGLNWVRVDLHWNLLEPQEQQFELGALDSLATVLAQQQIKSVFYLVGSPDWASSGVLPGVQLDQWPPKDDTVFANRLGMLAQRYPVVNAWQIWNEPNLTPFWQPTSSPIDYGNLLNKSADILHSKAPGKSVVIAGMAYYSQMQLGGFMLQELQKIGVLSSGVIAAYHPYSMQPEGDDPSAGDFVVRTKTLNGLLRKANVAGIWATEWGWSSYSGPIEEQPIIGLNGQADYLLRRLALTSAMDFDKVFLFALSDLDKRASVRDRSYGLLDINGNPKPSYNALANFLAITGPQLNPGKLPKFINLPKNLGIFSVSWMKPDGSQLLMFWALHPGVIQLAGITTATLYQPLAATSQVQTVSAGKLTVPITQQLQILTWR